MAAVAKNPGAWLAGASSAVVPARFIDASDGTAEHVWLPWLAAQHLPIQSAAQLVPTGRRAVMVAPHPDDEVLAVGGLWSQIAQLGRSLCLIAATDGDASHPDSPLWPAARLAAERPRETQRALAALGADATQVRRLRFSDGALAAAIEDFSERIADALQPHDVLFSTWRLDGHPDHDATGAACAQAARRRGVPLVEVPVWTWHWATPGDTRVPWQRAHRIALGPATVQAKQTALQAFASQLEPDPSTGAPAVLRPSIVQRAARPFEIVFL